MEMMTDYFKQLIGRNLSQRREEMGYSQEEVAQGVNKTKSEIKEIEEGKVELKWLELMQIAGVLSMAPYEVFFDAKHFVEQEFRRIQNKRVDNWYIGRGSGLSIFGPGLEAGFLISLADRTGHQDLAYNLADEVKKSRGELLDEMNTRFLSELKSEYIGMKVKEITVSIILDDLACMGWTLRSTKDPNYSVVDAATDLVKHLTKKYGTHDVEVLKLDEFEDALDEAKVFFNKPIHGNPASIGFFETLKI